MALVALAAGLMTPFVSAPIPVVAHAPVAHAEAAAEPGGVFITGHDADHHSQVGRGANPPGAQHIIQKAIEYVSYGAAEPKILFVSSLTAPPGDHADSAPGLEVSGYVSFDIATANPGPAGTDHPVVDLANVAFGDYDVVVVASDHGGILTQAELDILNDRSAEVIDFVNDGGGLVAFSESNMGSRLTPDGGHFNFLPFVVSEVPETQSEVGYTLTDFGRSLGLLETDVNGNISHNVFPDVGGLNVVDRDAQGRAVSAAVRGEQICGGGIPVGSVDDVSAPEGDDGSSTSLTFTVSLDFEPCRDVSLDYATADDTAAAGSDYEAASGSVTFAPGETSKSVSVPVIGDNSVEADETFRLVLSNATNAEISGSGTGTIVNDDVVVVLPSYTMAKSVSPTGAVTAGSTVDYKVTLTNTSPPGVAVVGASITDDLSDVLDDASFQSANHGGTLVGSQLTWAGLTVPADGTLELEYSVRVNSATDLGNGALVNSAAPIDAFGEPCGPDVCTTRSDVGGFTVTKTADPASGSSVQAGQNVEYTVTIKQAGQAPVSASVTDDLRDVLDDADIVGIEGEGAAFDAANQEVTWSGSLDMGGQALFSYTAQVKPDAQQGNRTLSNIVEPGSAGSCAEACATTHPVLEAAYTAVKTATPGDADPVDANSTVTYTVTVTNTGQTTLTAQVADALAGTVDDAVYNGDAAASGGTVTHPSADNDWVLGWSGEMAPGDEVTITYSVTVNQADKLGDGWLQNVMASDGPSNCVAGSTDERCATSHPVRAYTVVKTSDPESGTEVSEGDTIAYTVTVANIGQTTLSPLVSDDLSGVLDDAELVFAPTASRGSVTMQENTLVWEGELGSGDSATITYIVTVQKPGSGDQEIRNRVVAAGPSTCADDAESPGCVTNHDVVGPEPAPVAGGGGSDPLADTGSAIWPMLALAGLLLSAGVGALLMARRRRHAG